MIKLHLFLTRFRGMFLDPWGHRKSYFKATHPLWTFQIDQGHGAVEHIYYNPKAVNIWALLFLFSSDPVFS